MWTDPAWRAGRLAHAFAVGQTVGIGERSVTLRHHFAGDLLVTSGRIIACDPGWLEDDLPPFVTPVEPGRCPVVLSIAHFPDGDQRVAYATLRVRDGVPVRSEIAARLGDDAHAVLPDGEEYIPNYGVDTGQGCFMDADTLRLLVQQGSDTSGFDARLLDAMDKNDVDGWGWANLVAAPETGTNVIAFSSGEGDGGYVTYIGYDKNGHVVCFTTDFVVLEDDQRRGARAVLIHGRVL